MSLDWLAPPARERDEGGEPTARGARYGGTDVGDGRVAPETNGHRPAFAPRSEPVRFAPPATGADPGLDEWVPLGPAVTMHGQADFNPRISGRCRAIAVSPDGRRVYAGTAQGGTWFSADGGEHWLPLDFYATTPKLDGTLGESNALAVGSVAVRFGLAPNGDDDDVYVGTGESKFAYYAPLPINMQGVGVRVAHGPGPKVAKDGVTVDPWTLEATNLAGGAILRLVVDDATGDVWAATTKGLFKRPGSDRQEWEKIDTDLPDDSITDVAITRGEAGGPRRVYVASSQPALAFRPTTGSGDFTPVALPDYPLPPAARGEVTMVVLAEGNVAGHAVVYVLADGPRMWRVQDATAEIVLDLHPSLFGEQATYDMAIAAHPVTEDLIVLAGSTIRTPLPHGEYNAALFAAQVLKDTKAGAWRFMGTLPSTGMSTAFIGSGVHADVHDLSWVPGPTGGPPQLWVACDGGVFRSKQDGKNGTFDARNTGIGSIEAQYIAQHPTSDAVLLVGTQDNGAIRPLSPETWRVVYQGDAGGVAIDPNFPLRQFWQYTGAKWVSSLDGTATFNDVTVFAEPPADAPELRKKRFKHAHKDEADSTSPYGTVSAIADGPTSTQLVIGTDRVWFSGDWGANWLTLPSAKNPYDPTFATAPDRLLDGFLDSPDALNPGMVFVVKWASPNALHVVTKEGIWLFSRPPGGPWGRVLRYDRAQVRRDTKRKTPAGQIPAEMRVTDVASHDLHRAGLGSLYAGTSGTGAEHVWWFDGQGHWIPTGLPVDSPVHALVVDPAHPEVVYAGTDVGVWKAVGAIPAPGAGAPKWTWTHYSNALPEAACIDLVIHEKTRLLRAALRGRGVWEVALDGYVQPREAYIRAHAYDTRRRPVAASGPDALDPLGDPAKPTPLRLDASPDLKVYRGVGTAPPPFSGTWDAFEVWVLQSSLRAMGIRVEASGVWDAATKDANLVVAPPPGTTAEWNARFGGPNSNKPAFDHDPPDAADINVGLREEPDRRTTPKASCATGAGAARVFAVVHGRDFRPLAPNEVAVFVLRTPFDGKPDLSGVTALPAGWAASLRADLTSATPGTWLAGSKWAYLDQAKPFRRPARPVDPREAQVVEFAVPAAAWPLGDWLLLAVVWADKDEPKATDTNVATLVRQPRHVAARSVRRFAP